MADISHIKGPDNTSYDIKDATARSDISNLATVASTGSYNDLLNKPTVAEIDDNSTANNKAWSASNINSKLTDPVTFRTDDIPEGAANLGNTATVHRITAYRNGLSIPYRGENTNDGGILRVRGKTESDCILELGTWDDSGTGETIQFNYYPTTSQVTPTYSVSVPKKSGTIALTSDVDAKLSKAGDTATGKITFNDGIAIKAGDRSNRPPFFISLLQSYADGGAIGYTNQSDMQYAIGVTGESNHAASTGAALSSDTGMLGLHWYSQTGKIANQPTQYGFLLTCANSKGSVEQHSIFMEQANGSLYHMGTNASSSGSPPAYKKIWDSGNLNPQSALSTVDVSYTRSHASVGTEFKCWRYGNVVTIGGYFSCQATIAANTVLYSNFPRSKYIIYFTCKHEGNSGMYAFNMGTNGQLKTNQQIVAGNYLIAFTYVCA